MEETEEEVVETLLKEIEQGQYVSSIVLNTRRIELLGGTDQVVKVITQARGLDHLELNYVSLEIASVILESLVNHPTVQSLKLEHIKPSFPIEAMCRVISFNKMIRTLTLTNCGIDHIILASLVAALKSNRVIEILNLSRNPLFKTSLDNSKPFFDYIRDNNSLRNLIMANALEKEKTAEICRALCHNSTLESLDLSYNEIDGTALSALFLSKNSIAFFNCQQFKLPRDDMERVLGGMRSNSSLTNLKLQFAVPQTYTFSGSLLSTFSEMLKANKLIETLELCYINFELDNPFIEFAQSISELKALHDLNLRHLRIVSKTEIFKEENAVTMLMKSVSSLPLLKRFKISQFDFDDRISTYLQELLRRNIIETLSLDENDLNEDVQLALAEGLKSNTSLRYLSLERTQLKESFVSALIESLKENHSLFRLNVGLNNLGNELAKDLTVAVIENGSIADLNLDHNEIDEDGQTELLELVQESTSLLKFSILEDWMEEFEAFDALKVPFKGNAAVLQEDIFWSLCKVFSNQFHSLDLFDRSIVKMVSQFFSPFAMD
jgi:hypothetical protein